MSLINLRPTWTDQPNGRANRALVASNITSITVHWPGGGSNLTDLIGDGVEHQLRVWRNQHVANGWRDIGYNYLIDGHGQVWEGCGWHQGAHAGTTTGNATSIGVQLITGTNEAPTLAQIEAFRQLRQRIVGRAPRAYGIRPHSSWKATACPGNWARDLIANGTLSAPLSVTPPVPLTRFSDVPKSHTFYEQIEWLATAGISTGYEDRTFRPSDPVLREQMAAFLFRVAKPKGLADVPDSAGFRDEIAWLVGKGISTGFDDGTFRPAQAVTRADAAAMLYRLAGAQHTPPKLSRFLDVDQNTPHHLAIQWLAHVGATTGYHASGEFYTFEPNAPLLREHLAAFLFRLVKAGIFK